MTTEEIVAEIGKLEAKAEAERVRLEAQYPNAPSFNRGPDLEPSELGRFNGLNAELDRRQRAKRGDPAERVRLKRQLRREGFTVDPDAGLNFLRAMLQQQGKGST